ncbi:16S rRNA (adenine(1518)-N(6)/adenine(1519)-N(6))-dimethyltransferase [Corynebacterium sp. HMSC062E11]|uniref:16S rRNA (adenine(1518)-N(6)/adenine(1519)-N(6))- dimethyltransferase RsmA n=1 Tax=unclassified Corynebacterium TaxID=2624378 RepID=UPI0008A4CF63|nr:MULTISPECIES: 16S rRNA (adenine(1518)-N(6)/adenine(1519)-N(6))-dimethyltransferase RsmA [unclassified Corynebacterium]MDK6806817.1 16S rRNA (adenine(1518)-N(6)/adenine(1519)-N(6))-dimethyltransferase RsmA [Corynebacterium aurimucosum]NJJ83373.1 16S rRNA (adenine(1518)-N(6)/adenine(1519)-N(6))-dimethyltransferase RsmA [Corynebacterium aurimucosum]OFK29629.1 16S rRNA (adenine(1518)-N(6)/adenine(1519)-N(6))-dimethyltransferase [Corynebacterium sp. HMSC062E11]OFP69967.1 16S rRNA (adenine(1518)-N
MTQPHLLGPVEIRELAAELDVTPTKKLGQNFLHDPNTIRRIVAAADLSPEDHVVEVGPGLGSLTLGLLGEVAHVTAVEIDSRLAGKLPDTMAARAADFADRLSVVEKDALTVEAGELGEPTALVANLPYNVAVPVLLHLLEVYPSIRRVLVMVQLEVAERLAAAPGSKVYGIPSVKASFYGLVRQAGTIGKNVFWPAPKIESGLVRIDCTRPFDEALRPRLFALIDASFAQRRKTLRAALAGFYGSAAAAEEALRAANIDPRLRGEKLGVEDFVRLAEAS